MTDPPLGFHSLTEEVDRELDVAGDLPDWLSGTLVRNGPGAFELGEASVDHWFDGLAMLTAFTFDDGVRYRNRFLRTDAYEAAACGSFEAGFATGGSSLRGRLQRLLFEDPYDNTNVVAERVGETYVALTETPRWVAFDPDTLERRGHVQYDGPAPSGQLSCAHLRRDPATGTLVNVETAFGRTSRYHVHAVTGPGERDHVASIPVDEPAYMHSFALTPNYVVLTEFPFVVDPLGLLLPGDQGPFVEQFEWKPERGTRFLVVDRASGDVVADPRADAFFGFHHVNAYEGGEGPRPSGHRPEAGEELVVDLETVPSVDAIESLYLDALRAGELDALAGRLERFRVDLDAGTVQRRELYDGGTALPTVPPERWTRPYRYAYAQGTDRPVSDWPRTLVKVDVEAGTATTFEDGGTFLSEPIFVPRADGAGADGDVPADRGVVLAVALDREAERSDLLVLDGETMTERARAPLPHAVPFDFHGRFFPALTP
jgi:beta-carotene 15,15'-monooxygenase